MSADQASVGSVSPALETRANVPASRGPLKVLIVVVLGLAVLLTIGVLPKLRERDARNAAQSAVNKPRLVTYAKATSADATGKLVLPATAAPIETAIVYARSNGFVRDFRVDIGDRVKAGDVLAILDTPEVESDAAAAQAKASETELNQKISRVSAERYKRLAQVGVNSREQADEAEAMANTAEAALSSSRAELTRWNTLLGFRYVKAPFDGVVTKRNVEKGSLVTAGSSSGVTSLYEIARTETLKIQVDVPQSLAQDVRVGDEAHVLAGALTVAGKIVRTSGALDSSTRTLRTEIHIAGDQGILAGSFVRVALSTRFASPPVRVPANALVARAGGNFVFTVDDTNAIMPVKVMLGRELGTEAEIIAGLSAGTRVVTNPSESLAEGEVVELVERKASATAGAKSGAIVAGPRTSEKNLATQ